jgi:hypothetical protein
MDLLWLIVSAISVHDLLALLLPAYGREHIMVGEFGGAELLT